MVDATGTTKSGRKPRSAAPASGKVEREMSFQSDDGLCGMGSCRAWYSRKTSSLISMTPPFMRMSVNWSVDRSVVLDGVDDDEEDETEDRGGAEGDADDARPGRIERHVAAGVPTPASSTVPWTP